MSNSTGTFGWLSTWQRARGAVVCRPYVVLWLLHAVLRGVVVGPVQLSPCAYGKHACMHVCLVACLLVGFASVNKLVSSVHIRCTVTSVHARGLVVMLCKYLLLPVCLPCWEVVYITMVQMPCV